MKANGSSSESIALLIDADNAPAAKIQFILTELVKYGVVNIRRAYGNWKKQELASWEAVLHEYAIQPVQQFDLTKGKNAADMALLIDAMDILHTKNVGIFCLVSSDCDFTPLVVRLRADGKQVIGFGGSKAPVSLVKSCTMFVKFEEEKKTDGSGVAKVARVNQLKGDTKLMTRLRDAVKAAQDGEGWANLGAVGKQLRSNEPFKTCDYGFGKLKDLFGAIDLFEMKPIGTNGTSNFSVRERANVLGKS